MSGVKILALGVLVMAFAVGSAPGGSIHPTAQVHHRAAERIVSAPTSLVFAPTVAAQNLASPSYNPANSYNFNQNVGFGNSVGTQGSVTGLFLGVTGSNPTTPAIPASAPTNLAGPTPVQTLNSSPVSSPTTTLAPTSTTADAFINFGSGPYPEASTLTTGSPQAFFNSPAFTHLFGPSGPTSSDITNFENEVIATIQKTYNGAGLAISLTTDPKALAAHTMSVVSGASWVGNANAIGITDVGHDGFSFIDKFTAATSVDQLAVAIGHNLSHELMHAFGIADHPEQSGPFVDAAASTFQTLADPSTTFSPIASHLLSTLNFDAVGQSVLSSNQNVDGNQILLADPSPVPEPSTVVLWGMVGGLFVAYRRRNAA